VKSLNFAGLLGGGVLHTKLWLIDRTHVYVGSANMDWRSLSQVKELGLVALNCSCLAKDYAKIFDVSNNVYLWHLYAVIRLMRLNFINIDSNLFY